MMGSYWFFFQCTIILMIAVCCTVVAVIICMSFCCPLSLSSWISACNFLLEFFSDAPAR